MPARSDCVGNSCNFFFSSGPGCMVYCGLSPSLRAGHVSVMVMVLNTLPGGVCNHRETSLWVFSFLEELCAYIGVEHLPALKNVSPRACVQFSVLSGWRFSMIFFSSFPFYFFIFSPILHLLACLELYPFSLHTENFDRYFPRPTKYHLALGWGHKCKQDKTPALGKLTF